jgi:threonine synthase
MIGNPVSMPRVVHLVERYNQTAGRQRVFVVAVSEQAIMDWQLKANRNGHIACTHGGESLAGLMAAKARGWIDGSDIAVLDATAHALKFSVFQDMYFENRYSNDYDIVPDPALVNMPVYLHPEDLDKVPAPGKPLEPQEFRRFVRRMAEEIAGRLHLKKRA